MVRKYVEYQGIDHKALNPIKSGFEALFLLF